MQHLRNILVGFLVSFIGSIPLGYLNFIGFELYIKVGFQSTIYYLLGIISVEIFVIYFTLLFANKLIINKKLLKYIELFSILFMFLLAYIFYSNGNSEISSTTYLENFGNHIPFALGLFLSATNFIQIPFWTSWNIYLLNNKYIQVEKMLKFSYVFSTLLGTFFGMLSLILGLSYLSNQVGFLSKYLISYIIPFFFLGLGIFQAYKYYKKHLSKK